MPYKDYRLAVDTSVVMAFLDDLEAMLEGHMFDCMEEVEEKLLCYSAYCKMPPSISDKFRNVLEGSFHTFEDFIDGMWEVVLDIEEKK